MTNEPNVDQVELNKPVNSDSHDDVFRNTTDNDEPTGDCTENKDTPNEHEEHHPIELSQVVDNKEKVAPPPPSQLIEKPVVVAPVAYDKYEAMQPRLKKFLKIYQQSSKNNLGGPTENDIENSLNSKPLLVPQLGHNIASMTADTHVAAKSDDKSSINLGNQTIHIF